MMTRHTVITAFLGAFTLTCADALAQNIFAPPSAAPIQQPAPTQQPAQPAAPNAPPAPAGNPGPVQQTPIVQPATTSQAYSTPASEGLTGISLFVVNPPAPHKYAKNDTVQVIVNESSIQKIAQTYDNKKDYDFLAELKQFPSLEALFTQATLVNGIGTPAPSVGVGSHTKYKGDGKLNRSDQVTAKITAIVIDVKPNGTLVLEARESIQNDKEITTMVLSGIARSDDVTKSNTVQSSQLADLNVRILHEGDVKDTAQMGIIPRIFQAIFNF